MGDLVPIAVTDAATVYHCDWRQLLDVVPSCDLLCVDAPYSARTHAGHYAGTSAESDPRDAGRAEWLARKGYDDKRGLRRPLDYPSWTDDEVTAFANDWFPRCAGWIVSITDHVLARVWEREMRDADRYVFAPIPFVEMGKQPRLTGDGPASWTCWIIVSRPKSVAFSRWGSLPGAYVMTGKDQRRIPGGKPIGLMCSLVRDYSHPGDLCVDPCCGAGTLASAAIREGRRAIVGDRDEAHADLAAEWVRNPWRPSPRLEAPDDGDVQLDWTARTKLRQGALDLEPATEPDPETT